jgi:hypothetical protein
MPVSLLCLDRLFEVHVCHVCYFPILTIGPSSADQNRNIPVDYLRKPTVKPLSTSASRSILLLMVSSFVQLQSEMESERTETVVRARGRIGPPAKKPTPRNAREMVSAAAIFKQQSRKTFQSNVTPPANSNFKFIAEDADASTLLSVRSRSSVQSARQSGGRILKKRLEMHPVTVAFKGSNRHCRWKMMHS